MEIVWVICAALQHQGGCFQGGCCFLFPLSCPSGLQGPAWFLPAPRGALLPPGVEVGRGLGACGAILPPPVSCLQGTGWGMAAKGQL